MKRVIIFTNGNLSNLKRAKKIKLLQYPEKKDYTDLELVIDYCQKEKYDEIIFFGLLGDRVDHFSAPPEQSAII